MPRPTLERLIYIDDSGRPQAGLVVFGWVEFHPGDWAQVLRTWLDTRKRLWREFGIPVPTELHMTEYVNGRGRISAKVPDRHVHAGVEFWKDFGREVAVECLETLRCIEGLRVGAVYRRGDPAQIARTKAETYAALVARFEAELAEGAGSLALLFMDGDGRDPMYRTAHRELRLAQRRVVEDAIHLDSRGSQLVQMADHVAWSANAMLDPNPAHAFAADWYARHLSERDPMRSPQPI